jgi:hypothetical protein
MAVARLMGTWFFNRFNDTDHAEYVLDMSMFFANRAVLNKAVVFAQPFNERPLYTSPGLQLFKPSKTLAGTIIVSVLIAMQLMGLGILVWYKYSVPTWTTSLDALAVARIGREVAVGEIPPLGLVSEEGVKKMREVDALVGVKDVTGVSTGDFEESGGFRSGSELETDNAVMRNKEAFASNIELTLGGCGLIRRRLA